MPSNVVATAVTGDGLVNGPTQGESTLYGWNVLHTANNGPIAIRVDSVSGAQVARIQPSALNVSTTQWFGPQGVRVNGAIWVEFEGGTPPTGTVVIYHG